MPTCAGELIKGKIGDQGCSFLAHLLPDPYTFHITSLVRQLYSLYQVTAKHKLKLIVEKN